MDGTFVKELERITQSAAGRDVVVDTDDGRELSTVQLHPIPKDLPPDEPAPLRVHSLTGLVDYIEANRDELEADECMVHVVTPTLVRIVSKLQPRAKRFSYLEAEALDLVQGWLGRAHSLEDATITFQSWFEDRGDRASVLAMVGNVRSQAEVTVEDDGITQHVQTRGGVHLSDEVKVPNPVVLAPYRTFREIEQVESPFVLRIKKGGPSVELHEADGGEWELKAVERIAEWLDGKVGDFAILH